MASIPPTAFETLMKQLGVLPLWIKQVIYAHLRQDLERALSKGTLEAFGHDDVLQLLVPELTRTGLRELEQPGGQQPQSLLKLLYLVRQGKSVVDIAILNNWTLERCVVVLLEAIDKGLVLPPKSGIILATIHYLAGRTRLGEYLVKINRLSMEQLDQALRTQHYIEESMGERTGIANVLINLGYIKKEDSEGILFLKAESQKAFEDILQLKGVDPDLVQKQQNQLAQAMQRIRDLELENRRLQQRP